ncbi:Cpe/LpqF family protein [Leucobacter chinensis]|uniref:Cpe/LpqF family protein n=1 Tax=Leucobacter chinensis TaxID=2851010 RepID=UPI001C226A8E|nr:Cpe/LpqF family protein [Leucobacter chinensis]
MVSIKKTLGVSMLALALVLTGCTSTPEVEKEPAAVTEIAFPDSEAGTNSKWVVDQLNSDDIDPANWQEKLSDKLLEEMSAEELVKVLDEGLKPGAPYMLVSFSESGEQAVLGLMGADDAKRLLTLSFEKNGEISGIFYKNA